MINISPVHTHLRTLIRTRFGNDNDAGSRIFALKNGREPTEDDRKAYASDISMKLRGTRTWGIHDLIAVMVASGDFSVLDTIRATYGDDSDDVSETFQECAAIAAKECGEAVAAAIRADDPASIIQEATEAIAELERIRDKAKAEIRGLK